MQLINKNNSYHETDKFAYYSTFFENPGVAFLRQPTQNRQTPLTCGQRQDQNVCVYQFVS